MQLGAPPPPPAAAAAAAAVWRAPTFEARRAADAREILAALLPPSPTVRQVQQAHARLAVLGLAASRAMPHLLAVLPRLLPDKPRHRGDDGGGDGDHYAYPLALFRRANSTSAFASNNLLRVLPHPLPLTLFSRFRRRNPHSFTFLLASISNHLNAAGPSASACSFLGSHVHALAVKAGAAGDLFVRNALVHFYGVSGDVGAMRRVFDELPRVRDVLTWNEVLAGYVRAGMMTVAREVFDEMPVRDEISWSTLVGGYVKEEELEVALGVFRNMVEQGVRPNQAAVVTALSAAARLGLLEHGKFVHNVVQRSGMPVCMNVGAALVDMYAKCGCVAVAREVFDGMRRRDVFAWNAMICGLAAHGLGRDAVELFERFISEGLSPTNVTFVGVLNGCSRSGLVAEGRRYFKLMVEKYRIEPEMEHYGCMVDLLGRAGLVPEAIELIEGMHIAPDPVLWGTILSSCKTHGLVDLGVSVGNKLIELDPTHSGYYVLLSGIYAKANKWDDVREVRKLMSSRGTSKSAGWSLMEAHGKVHKFLVGDTYHKDSVQIYDTLDMINKRLTEAGYVPDVSSVLHDIGEEEKVHAVKVHSERLAIAYGFIVLEAGSPIRIVKNLRVCGDCHEFIAGNADELTGVKQVQRRIREAGCEVLRVDHAGGMEEGHAKHGRADWG
uniref:DYW domain-containing protein n=1 Tax=Oryza glumipatula TaxID=40148 RepID=A0A0E0AG39_9ORYZ